MGPGSCGASLLKQCIEVFCLNHLHDSSYSNIIYEKRRNTVKVAILAGGLGTRLSEETKTRPKALVEIGGRPILWHIMMYYSTFGFNEFIIALGYRGKSIISWMHEYYDLSKDVSVKENAREVVFHDKSRKNQANWRVHLIDTGQKTLTGGRIKRLAPWLSNETFMLTWCDAVSNVDFHALLKFHLLHRRLATVTAVRPPPRFGHLKIEGDRVTQFKEKAQNREGWINGAFFVLEPQIFDYIEGDNTQWEKEPMEKLAREGQLMAYRHYGYWRCMDTLKEKLLLEEQWRTGRAPWKTWKDGETIY
jgi:glucose-1-phosphate cytidylyltransferase